MPVNKQTNYSEDLQKHLKDFKQKSYVESMGLFAYKYFRSFSKISLSDILTKVSGATDDV